MLVKYSTNALGISSSLTGALLWIILMLLLELHEGLIVVLIVHQVSFMSPCVSLNLLVKYSALAILNSVVSLLRKSL